MLPQSLVTFGLELPSELLPNACLEVDELIFDRDEIRRLYDSDRYPLSRRLGAR
jgi:hypothetical protein